MIVQMRTIGDAESVAALVDGATHLPGKAAGKMSRRVDLGDACFELHRPMVESVSTLYRLFNVDGVEVASGWLIRGAEFEVEWPADRGLVYSHFGARRQAFNWALAAVKTDLAAREIDPTHRSTPWSLQALRKRWNDEKNLVAPWWAENSKECYAAGIADCATALSNWKSSKDGVRKGGKVGFPRFESRRAGLDRVRFTTGAMRLTNDRRHVVLPVIGVLRSKENTRRVHRLVSGNRGRVLSMTLSQRWGRLFVSVNYTTFSPVRPGPSRPGSRCGVDLGMRTLATVVDDVGHVTVFNNPAPLRATLTERRRVGRQMSRRIVGSAGHRAAKAKLSELDRRCVSLRREAYHQLTSTLASTYGRVVIEDLNIAAMKRSMGRVAFRRSVSDTALGMFRPMLTYKMVDAGSDLVVADRWFASSQIHHGCECRLQASHLLAKHLTCEVSGEQIDRDINAAFNLRDWTDNPSCSSVGSTAPNAVPASARTTTVGGRGRTRKTFDQHGQAESNEAKTKPKRESRQLGTPKGVQPK